MITNFYYALWANLFLKENDPNREISPLTTYSGNNSSCIQDLLQNKMTDLSEKDAIINNVAQYILFSIFRSIPTEEKVRLLNKDLRDKNVFLYHLTRLSVEYQSRMPYIIKAHINELQFKLINRDSSVTYENFVFGSSRSTSALSPHRSSIELQNKTLIEVAF